MDGSGAEVGQPRAAGGRPSERYFVHPELLEPASMGAWLDRLKIQPSYRYTTPENSMKTGSQGSLAYPQSGLEKLEGTVSQALLRYPQGTVKILTGTGQQPDTQAANDAAPDPDSIATHSKRVEHQRDRVAQRRAALFVRRGADEAQAERLAETLVQCDRGDSMHACMEVGTRKPMALALRQLASGWRIVRAGDAGLARTMACGRSAAPGSLRLLPCPATVLPYSWQSARTTTTGNPVQPQPLIRPFTHCPMAGG